MSYALNILVVDDEKNARLALKSLLEEDGHTVCVAGNGLEALKLVEQAKPNIILTDLKMPKMDGLALLDHLKQKNYNGLIIMMTAFASIETAVQAIKSGAYDYMTKPLDYSAVELMLTRAAKHLKLVNEVETLRQKMVQSQKRLLGQSDAMVALNKLMEQVAPSMATILIMGDSGTGKELVARQLHDWSGRANQAFVPMHCAALPETLLEDELFGHEKGAFTGAATSYKGCFERAEGGTLFLDEIGEISPMTQVKLLRVLQERRVRRLGGQKSFPVDVRLLCATNKNLVKEVEEGRFREDLFYRLNVIQVTTPKLQHRQDDIIPLARHFLNKFALINQKELIGMSDTFKAELLNHHWPGNVRELENAMERAVVLAAPTQTILETLSLQNVLHIANHHDIKIPGSTLSHIEQISILKTYEACDRDTQRTANMLDISRRKVQYVLKKHTEMLASSS